MNIGAKIDDPRYSYRLLRGEEEQEKRAQPRVKTNIIQTRMYDEILEKHFVEYSSLQLLRSVVSDHYVKFFDIQL